MAKFVHITKKEWKSTKDLTGRFGYGIFLV